MPLVVVRRVPVAHPALRGAHLHVLHKLAVYFGPRGAARRICRDGGARRQIEDAREQTHATRVVPTVTAARVWKISEAITYASVLSILPAALSNPEVNLLLSEIR
jgi:hypothetical protein